MTEEDSGITDMRQRMLEALAKKAGKNEVGEDEPKNLKDRDLHNQARRLGRGWSNWINSAASKNWRELDPKLINDWTAITVRVPDFEQIAINRIILELAKGMGIEGDSIKKGQGNSSNDKKIHYVYNSLYSDRRHLVIGVESLSIRGLRNLASGIFLVASTAHLSELKSEDRPLKLLQSDLIRTSAELGGLHLAETCAVISEWLVEPEVRVYFAERELIRKAF